MVKLKESLVPYIDNSIEAKITEILCKQANYWDTLFYRETLIHQLPKEVILEDGSVNFLYGINTEKILPPYKITDIILLELTFGLLDKVESIKYSRYKTNATTLLLDSWNEHQIPHTPSNNIPNCFSLKYIYDFYTKYNLETIDTFESGRSYDSKDTVTIKKISSHAHSKLLISKFLSDNEASLAEIGLHKRNNRYMIPLYSSASLLQRFAIEKMNKRMKTDKAALINSACILNKFDLERSNASCYAIMVLQYYKNARFLGFHKKQCIKKYYNLLLDEQFLSRIRINICPNLDNGFNNNAVEEIIIKAFFSSDFLDKYNKSQLLDCFLFVYHYFISGVLINVPMSNSTFLNDIEILRNNILDLMDIPLFTLIKPIINAEFNSLLVKHNNSIVNIEKDLVEQLKLFGIIKFENYTNVFSSNPLTN